MTNDKWKEKNRPKYFISILNWLFFFAVFPLRNIDEKIRSTKSENSCKSSIFRWWDVKKRLSIFRYHFFGFSLLLNVRTFSKEIVPFRSFKVLNLPLAKQTHFKLFKQFFLHSIFFSVLLSLHFCSIFFCLKKEQHSIK